MTVRLVDLARLHAPLRADIDAAIGRVIDSGRFVLGAEVDAFEREIASAIGAAHAIAVSSGSDALLALLWAHGVGPGDEVIVPAFTFVAPAAAIARAGATPVFADIDDDFAIDASDVRAQINARTRAIIVVDLFGRRADAASLSNAGPTVIADSAQAMGPRVGSGASSAAISFFPTKNLGALGDGGLVVTNDASLADRVRLLRSHGGTAKYRHERLGWNMRLDAIQAAVLRVKLTHLDSWNAARRRIATTYRESFAGIDELIAPTDAPDHVWHQFVVRTRRRDALAAHLAERGIETAIHYPVALHLQPCFAALGGKVGQYPRAEDAARTALALPIHPMLDAPEIEQVTSSVRGFFGAS